MYDVDLDAFLESKKVVTNIVPTNKNDEYDKINQVVETYTKEGYSCMTYDSIRNRAYQIGINAGINLIAKKLSLNNINITEIGPGADACLTKMVAQTRKGVMYKGIEGNKDSAKKCQKLLRNLHFDPIRYKIIQAMSNDTKTELNSIYRETHILLHELVGFIASREGLIYILNDICKRNYNKLPKMIPSIISTFFTPTFVDKNTFKKTQGIMRVEKYPNIILMQPFPFNNIKTTPLWPQCGTLEFFDFLSVEDNSIDLSKQMMYKSEFTIETETKINSLTCFIYVGFESDIHLSKRHLEQEQKKGEDLHFKLYSQDKIEKIIRSTRNYFSTCYCLPPTSHGWPNVIFLFPEITLHHGTVLHVLTYIDFKTDIPKYKFRIWSTNDTKKENEFLFDFI